MSEEKPVVTAVPQKVRAVLRLRKAGPFKAGDKFEVTATAGQLFKGQRFGRIRNAEAFRLRVAMVGAKEQPACGIVMSELNGPMAEIAWPACMHPEKVTFSVEAAGDASEFLCEIEGFTVRSVGDARTHDYDQEPLDVTLGTPAEHN